MKSTLRDLREQSGKTVTMITSELNVAVSTYYNYEQGIRRINIDQVLILAKLYDCSAEEIIKAQLNSCQNAR